MTYRRDTSTQERRDQELVRPLVVRPMSQRRASASARATLKRSLWAGSAYRRD